MANEGRINNSSSNGVGSSLRQYRFQKSKNVIQHNSKPENQHAAELKLVPGKRRIHILDDSNSSNESCTPTKHFKKMGTDTIDSANISMIRDREARLIAVKQKAPMYDTMVCQDALVTCNWNVEESVKYLQEHCAFKKRFNNTKTEWLPNAIPAYSESSNAIRTPGIATAFSNAQFQTSSTSSMNRYASIGSLVSSVSSSSLSSSTTATHQKPVDKQFQNGQSFLKLKKTKEYVEQRSDDSGDDQEKPTERVFDSDDDSDTEYSTFMTKDRKNVFDFINNGSVNELICVKTCSTKKIDCIMELRPFRDWADLVKKLQNHKFLSSDLLNACQEYLARRNNVATVMKKCNRIVQRLETVVGDSRNIVTQPSILNPNCKLADYQMVGLNWLALMNKEEMNGILADEMGLGKTIQVIAFLAYLKEKQKSKATHLIIVPSSTLDNWELELSKWCPTLRVEKYYGSATDRKVLRISWARAGGLKDVDVILTTYHMVSSSPEERKMFRIIRLHYVIFDEAHMLKNMTTQRYAQLIRINSDRRLLLTGTPLQNSLLELMSLLCFVMPSLFANKAEDIKSLFQKNKLINSDEIGSFEQTQIDQAKRIMKPFVLRRLKKDVLNALPKKFEISKKIPLLEYQKKKYMDLVECYSSEKGVVKATVEISGMSIMMDMRKLANHPLLQRYYYSDECVMQVAQRLAKHSEYKKTPNAKYIFEELAILSDFQLFQTMQRYDIFDMPIPDELILNSGKINELDQLLPQLKLNGHRVLIFSQFTMMLDILERYLDIREYRFLRLDGSTPVTERQELIDKYMTDSEIFVFLLSTKAGGLGINLTAADTVIIHDIDFNPYNDKQAEDRCHRMGQTKPVTIYRFIAEGTIEEGMSMVALEKLNLEKEITNDDISNDNGEVQEQKCMVRLLTTALGIDKNRVETLLTPKKII